MLTKFENKHLEQPGKIMVKFGAPWCGPCRSIAPVLEELVQEGLNIYEVNTDEEQELASKYNIRSLPTLIMFKDGFEHQRYMGVQPKQKLIKLMENN